MQVTVLRITLLLVAMVIVFTLFFSNTFSRRLNKVMTSMRIIQNGDYTHKVNMGGNDELTVLGNEFNDLAERLRTSEEKRSRFVSDASHELKTPLASIKLLTDSILQYDMDPETIREFVSDIGEEKRSRFVSDASHELKTPLASIKLLTDSILQYDMDPETIREFVSDIGAEAERLNRMTAKLLSLTKAEGAAGAESEIIYMAPTIRRVAKMLRQQAQQADIHVELELERDVPVLILEDDLYQIVFNLMENGIKYNTPGGASKRSKRISTWNWSWNGMFQC